MPVRVVLSPTEFVTSPGIAVRLNASSSYDTEDEVISFTWEFIQTPVGSRLEAADLASADLDNSIVIFTPDQVGTYVVQLTVENETGLIDTATAAVMSQYSLGFTKEPTTPDASYIFTLIPDFWKNVANNEVFSILWSGYTQIVGADLSRVYQNSDAKSLATIRSVYERRWLPYHPFLPLDKVGFTLIMGDVQGGLGARTTDDSQEATAVVISHQEIVLLGAVPTERAVGQQITILSGGNTGTYTVLRLNADSTGYVVRRNSFSSGADTLTSGEDLYGLRTSQVLTSATVDFAAAGVVAGDVLKVVAGADSGFYTITHVGVAGGLTNDRRVQVETPLLRNRTGITFSVLRPCTVSIDFPGTAYSTRVYLPATEADLTKYQAPSFTGEGVVRGPYEIAVAPRHVFDSMVGKQILITSGPDGGTAVVLSGVSSSRDGYYLSFALSAGTGASFSYTLSPPYAITDRLITVGGVTAPILDATLFGADWVVTVPRETVPAGLSGAAWYIGHMCTFTAVDVEEGGASVGDVLYLTVRAPSTGYVTEVAAAVIGVYANKVMLANGEKMPTLTAGGRATSTFTDEEKYKFFHELSVPSASYDEDTETATLSRVARSVAKEIGSLAFQTRNFNLPASDETTIIAGDLTVTFAVAGLLRNSKLKVATYLRSAPALFEYIRDPVFQQDGTGYTLVATDGTTSSLTRPPKVLQHNDEYVIDYDISLKGDNASITSGSATVTLPGLQLLSIGVAPGDTLKLRIRSTTSSYLICQVTGQTTLVVRPVEGVNTTFQSTASGLRYEIIRRQEGNYLRLLPGVFTSTDAAPRYLWAEISLFDNAPTIEANFGTLVGITKSALDAYGTSQDSYLTVVRGIAYGLSHGPTLLNVAVSSNLLLGAPVSPRLGIIYDIDEGFSTSRGKVTLQDISEDGVPQAAYRSFLYARENYAAPGFYGLAVNPLTGVPLAVGDVVLDNQLLSRAVVVTDYVADPDWWRRYGSLRGREIEKYHSWEVVVDLLQLPAEDLTLVADFLAMARPIYTRPNIVGLLYLRDDVTVETFISFDGTLLLFDDPAFSVESTHMADDYNESSAVLRALDIGSFGTRVLFRGRDLTTAGGDGTGFLSVTSLRGGFTSSLTAAVNSYFSSVPTRGDHMVRAAMGGAPGDVLQILTGPNRGLYEVSAVVSDTELLVRQLGTDYFESTGVTGPYPDEARAATEQEFTIQRLNGPLITYGTGSVTAGSSLLSDAAGNFLTNNVAVGDVLLVIGTGGDTAEYEVLDVIRTVTGTQNSIELVVDTAFAADDVVEYFVYREALFQNPIFQTESALCDGTAIITIPEDHAGSFLRAGDIVEILSGPAEGRSFVIAGLPTLTSILVLPHVATAPPYATEYPPPPLSGTETSLQVVRPSLDSAEDSDSALETLWVGETTTFDVMSPVTLYLSLSDGVVDVATRTVSSFTDFESAGVLVGMKVQFASALNNGVYEIEAVNGTILTLATPPGVDESGVALTIVTQAAEFTVDGAGGVTTVSGYNLLGDLSSDPLVASLMPGDIFEYDGNQVMITAVLATSFSLWQVPPPSVGTFPGKVLRTRKV